MTREDGYQYTLRFREKSCCEVGGENQSVSIHVCLVFLHFLKKTVIQGVTEHRRVSFPKRFFLQSKLFFEDSE